MKNLKKLLALVLALAMMLTLFGCESDKEDDSNETTENSTGPSGETSDNGSGDAVAAMIGDHEIGVAELSYYFMDAINAAYQEWSQMFGNMTEMYVLYSLNLDLSAPLDEQVREDGTTWGAYFLDMALQRVTSDYALCQSAAEEGFVLTDAQFAAIDAEIETLSQYAPMYAFENADEFLRSYYGEYADTQSFKSYITQATLAQAYYNAYADSLSYSEEDIRAYESGKYNQFSSYRYAIYSISYTSFLTDESGDPEDATEEEIRNARAQAEVAANTLSQASSLEELNDAIAALSYNQTGATATTQGLTQYSNLPEEYKQWLSSEERTENEVGIFPTLSSATDENGNIDPAVDTYTVVMLLERNDNNYKAANVRHLLVKFASADGSSVFTDEEKEAAKAAAEAHLETWKSGVATEESFIALVKAYSEDPGSASTGGLYTDIVWETQFVPEFLNWSMEPGHEPGDYGIIQTDYGYHIMYYSGSSERTYRDTLIYNALMDEDIESWYTAILSDVTAEYVDSSLIDTHVIISPN